MSSRSHHGVVCTLPGQSRRPAQRCVRPRTLMTEAKICGRLEGGIMSDIRGGSNLPHIVGTFIRVAPPTTGVNLAQFGDKWPNSKTQISKLDFDQKCGRLDPPLMSDIKPPSNLPHILASIIRVPPPTVGAYLSRFWENWPVRFAPNMW